jgi:hypothetical protein
MRWPDYLTGAARHLRGKVSCSPELKNFVASTELQRGTTGLPDSSTAVGTMPSCYPDSRPGVDQPTGFPLRRANVMPLQPQIVRLYPGLGCEGPKDLG